MEHFNSSYISHFLLRGLLYSISVRTSSSYYTYCIHTHSHIVHIIFIHSFIHSCVRSFVRSYHTLCYVCIVLCVLCYIIFVQFIKLLNFLCIVICIVFILHIRSCFSMYLLFFWTILCVCWIIFSITWFNTYLQRARFLYIKHLYIYAK